MSIIGQYLRSWTNCQESGKCLPVSNRKFENGRTDCLNFILAKKRLKFKCFHCFPFQEFSDQSWPMFESQDPIFGVCPPKPWCIWRNMFQLPRDLAPGLAPGRGLACNENGGNRGAPNQGELQFLTHFFYFLTSVPQFLRCSYFCQKEVWAAEVDTDWH